MDEHIHLSKILSNSQATQCNSNYFIVNKHEIMSNTVNSIIVNTDLAIAKSLATSYIIDFITELNGIKMAKEMAKYNPDMTPPTDFIDRHYILIKNGEIYLYHHFSRQSTSYFGGHKNEVKLKEIYSISYVNDSSTKSGMIEFKNGDIGLPEVNETNDKPIIKNI